MEKTDNRFAGEMKAWLMIQVIGQTSVNFFNRKKLAGEIAEHLRVFEKNHAGIDNTSGGNEDKLKDFSEYFIDSCLSSKSYKTAVFGAIPMSDAGAAVRLLQDIDEVTRIIPERFGLSENAKPLRYSLLDAYRRKVDGAEKFMDELGVR
ncbi:MAG: hypothetical protein IJ695_08355 [Butyrivibrio sp.]|nr:hypothetical protein [Butyrivibrio sp.]